MSGRVSVGTRGKWHSIKVTGRIRVGNRARCHWPWWDSHLTFGSLTIMLYRSVHAGNDLILLSPIREQEPSESDQVKLNWLDFTPDFGMILFLVLWTLPCALYSRQLLQLLPSHHSGPGWEAPSTCCRHENLAEKPSCRSSNVFTPSVTSARKHTLCGSWLGFYRLSHGRG